MPGTLQFYVADLETMFHVIGSADRELLLDIGVTLGSEFKAPGDDEEDEFFGDEDTEEPPEWDAGEEEADAAREIITKMIMTELPHDLAEDEAYAVQDYFAGVCHRSETIHLMEPGDLGEDVSEDDMEAIQDLLLGGLEEEEVSAFCEWLVSREPSHELLTRIQVLYLGRLPESDDPTFPDLEDDAYAARFAYVFATEAAQVTEEMKKLLADAPEELRPVALLLYALLRYSASHALDLVVTIDE